MNRVLIVVDMQNDFIDGSLGSFHARSIVGNVKEKIRKYHQNGDNVIFTRDTHDDNYLKTQEGKNLPIKHCIIDTYGWNITDKLSVENAVIWDKKSFGSLELAAFIKEKTDIDEIEIIGLCTDICVVSNALILKAFIPEIKITVDATCCAGVTEEGHKAALQTMKMCQVNIINGER